ncbi:TonB family protein [Chitinophaga sp. Mgbs1]|uniref:TonB family protein n=1 Tax=Chitinophaga solisilvae TaxID=1233460 RepID=A0A9Q5D719_9BACT|nr:TonB family protein [Chitinophaga solisilvae]
MKLILSLCCCCFLWQAASSQTYRFNDSTFLIFLNDQQCEVEKKEDAASFRLIYGIHQVRARYDVKDFYVTGELKMAGGSTSKERLIRDGEFAWYRKGEKRPYQTGNYSRNGKTGVWFEYYPNGKVRQQSVAYLQSEREKRRIDNRINTDEIINSWDSTGTQEVKEGNGAYSLRNDQYKVIAAGLIKNGWKEGAWEYFDSTGKKLRTEEYSHGVLQKGINFKDGQELTYTIQRVLPVFPGGTGALGSFISTKLVYPRAAISKSIQGTVLVRFTVTTDGTLRDITICQKVEPSMDKEALRVVSIMPPWTPGETYGAKQDEVFILPVRFVLE